MDTIGEYSYFGSWILPLVVFAGTMWFLRRLSTSRRTVVAFLFSGSAFLTLHIVAWSIFFRDGLGPGMVESIGMESISRCWPGLALALAVGTLLIGPGAFLARRRPTTENAMAEQAVDGNPH